MYQSSQNQEYLQFEIQTGSDLSGMLLSVSFSERLLDKKALYTIQADMPPFLLPFRHRMIDGRIECTYQVGNNSKLLYQSGQCSPEECVDLWTAVLQPLLDCKDWFLNPYSFVMDANLLFVPKSGTSVRYLYIPALLPCSGQENLRSMVTEISKRNPVSDMALENKILKAMMDDFQPQSFLQMLRENSNVRKPDSESVKTPVGGAAMQLVRGLASNFISESPVREEENVSLLDAAVKESAGHNDAPIQENALYSDGDIMINLNGSGSKKKEKHGKGENKKGKEEGSKQPKKSGGLFGSKKQKGSKEIQLGAGAESSDNAPPKKAAHNVQSRSDFNRVAVVPGDDDADSGVTQLAKQSSVPSLQRIGNGSVPQFIGISLEPGGLLTIGRYDIEGKIHSDVEFDKTVEEVSRRHAVIERNADGSYSIIDMASSYGTFVNMERLQPNLPVRLTRDCRVSFGSGGADYIWKE